jgi:hypothetical protein
VARLIRRTVPWLVLLALILAGYLFGRDYVRRHPQDVPWTPLRLDDPIGAFTLRKLAALSDDPGHCRSLLAAANSADLPAPPRLATAECGYRDGMRLAASPAEATFSPQGLVTRCPVAAAAVLWERQCCSPRRMRHFGAA